MIVLLGLCSCSLNALCQEKQIEYREQTWFGYFNQTRFTKHSGLWLDLHLRFTEDFIKEKSVGLSRIGYTYYAGDAKLTAGYAYAMHYAHGTNKLPEHRLWQQVQWTEKKKHFLLMQWIRLEERFRTLPDESGSNDTDSFNYRARYNIAFSIPLVGKQLEKGTPFLFINNELHVNFGKEIVVNYFDQNRLFAGLAYQFASHSNVQLGYMYVFQQTPVENAFVHIDAIRLFVFHNLNFSTDN